MKTGMKILIYLKIGLDTMAKIIATNVKLIAMAFLLNNAGKGKQFSISVFMISPSKLNFQNHSFAPTGLTFFGLLFFTILSLLQSWRYD